MAMCDEWPQIWRRALSWRQTGVFLILWVGLALATVMFAIGHSYSSRSLPYKNTERLVAIGVSLMGGRFPALFPTAQLFHKLRERSDLFDGVAALQGREGWRLRTQNGNVSIPGEEVTANFFDVLGVSFSGLEEWKRSAGTRTLPVPVFTHRLGMKEFGDDARGRVYRTPDGGGIVVGGMLPANFAFPHEDMAGDTRERGITPVPADDIRAGATLIGRLAPGVTPGIVEQALVPMLDEDAAAWGKTVVRPLQDIMAESSRPIVWGSWALCGLVLILCSANLSGILLVRCSYRLREYAVRTALGAGFLDLARLLLMELAIMSILAAIAAWLAGRAVVAATSGMVPVKYLSFGRPVFGWEEMAFLVAGTVILTVLSALAALAVIGRNCRRGFSRGQWAAFHSHRWMRMLLTAGQAAIAMLLLSLSYMTVRGYLDMFTQDVGLDTGTRVVSVLHSPAFSDSMRKSAVQSTLAALRGSDASAPVAVYRGRLFDNTFSIFLFDASSPVHRFLKPGESVDIAHVSPGFFRTVKARVLAGREFGDQGSGDEVLLNATFAKRMGWSPPEAVGQRLGSSAVVVGVVDDFATASWDSVASMTLFRPLDLWLNAQFRGGVSINYIVHPTALSRAGNAERTILRIDPDAVVSRNTTWRDLLGESVRGQTFAVISVVLFAIAAIAIVVVGVANTVMFIMARRTREIAVHMAMGASPGRVCWFVTGDMVKSGVVGILTGGMASWLAGRAAAHFIYHGDRYQNLAGLALTSAAMALIVAIASLIPALRIFGIELNRALHLE